MTAGGYVERGVLYELKIKQTDIPMVHRRTAVQDQAGGHIPPTQRWGRDRTTDTRTTAPQLRRIAPREQQ